MTRFFYKDTYVNVKCEDQSERCKTQVNSLLKSEGFWWNKENYCWSLFGLYAQESLFEKVKFLDEIEGSSIRAFRSFKHGLENREWVRELNIPMDESCFKLPPLASNRRKQLRLINHMLKYEASIVNAGVGSGKTFCSLTAFNHLEKHNIVDKIIIVTLGSVQYNWVEEITRFTWIKEEEIFIMDSAKNRNPWENTSKYKVLLFTYDNLKIVIDDIYKDKGFSWKAKKHERKYCWHENFLKWSDSFQLIIDEAHWLNNHQSINNHYVTALSRISNHICELTGSLFRKFSNEIYQHINILSPELVDNLDDNASGYSRFLDVTAELASAHSTTIKKTKEDMMEYLNKIYYKYIIKSKVTLNVDVDFVKVPVELSDKHMNFYKNVAQWIMEESSEDEEGITASSFFSSFPLYSQSLADPQMVIEKFEDKLEDFEWCLEDNEKFNILLDLLEKHKDTKIVIWLRNPFVIDLIYENLKARGHKIVKYHGKVKPPKGLNKNAHKQALVNDFNFTDKYNIGIFNPSTLGTGQNLQSASVDIFLTIPNNVIDDYLQTIGRLARPTQTRDITHYLLVAKNTIDEVAYHTLNHRSYLNDLKAKYTHLTKKQIRDTLLGKIIE